MNYTQAQNMFDNSRKRKLANNTYLEKNEDGSFGIRLHQTQIITFYPDKTVLNSGGWRSVTTKARINEFALCGSKWSLYQAKGIWYLATGPNIDNTFVSQEVFADGVTLTDNNWTNTGPSPKTTQKLRKQVRQYAKDFTKAMFAGEVEKPGAGDCFYCGMVTVENKQPLGEAVQDEGHILNHLEDSYFVPSLLVNACKMFAVSKAAWWAIQELWETGKASDCFADVAKRQIESSIRRYCYRQLKTA